MLVVSRKIGEDIIINDKIVVRVLGVKRRQIKIGIEAPAEDKIRRGELPPLKAAPAAA